MVTKKLIPPSRRGGKPQHATRPAGRQPPTTTRKHPFFPIHALAKLLPPMPPVEFEELVADIKRHGQLEPITLYRGRVLDGVHRQRACQQLKLTPLYADWKPGFGANGITPAAYVVAKNVHRRHLNAGQRAALALRFAKE